MPAVPGPWNEGGLVDFVDGFAVKFREFDHGPPGQAQPLDYSADSSTPFLEWWNGENGSPEFEFRDDGSRAVRTQFINWDDGTDFNPTYFQAVRDILGYPVVTKSVTSTGGYPVFYLSRSTPVYHPELVAYQHPVSGFTVPGDNPRGFLYATQVRRLQGLGTPAVAAGETEPNLFSTYGCCRYRFARIQVLYETLTYEVKEDSEVLPNRNSPYNLGPDGQPDPFAGFPCEDEWFQDGGRYVTHIPNPSSMQLTLPQGSLVYVAGNPDGSLATVTGSPPRTVPNADVEVRWHNVPRIAVGLRAFNPYITTTFAGSPYVPAIEDCLGCVNAYDFNNYAKGTLLLNSVAIVPVRSALGNRLVDLRYRFAYLPVHDVSSLGQTTGAQGWSCLYWALNPPPLAVDGTGGMGFYEVVNKQGSTAPASNYSNFPPKDGLSIFNFRDFRNLFRCAQLNL